MSALIKLNEARQRFHATEIKKSGHNKFAGYYYFELGDFLAPALAIFNEIKLSGVVSFTAELATMTITDLEDNSTHLITSPMSSAALKGCHEVQNLGAVQTYLRRYLWVCALEIVEHDAVDSSEPLKPGANSNEPADKPSKPRLPTLTDAEAAIEYKKWMEVKSLLVDHEGDPDQDRIANEWGRLASNVRTAIKRHGEAIKATEQLDREAAEHIRSLTKEAA